MAVVDAPAVADAPPRPDLSLSLVVYAVHVPMLIGFTVARYHEPSATPAR